MYFNNIDLFENIVCKNSKRSHKVDKIRKLFYYTIFRFDMEIIIVMADKIIKRSKIKQSHYLLLYAYFETNDEKESLNQNYMK